MAVIEMGPVIRTTSKELVRIARPNYGVITNIGRAHLSSVRGNYPDEKANSTTSGERRRDLHREDDVLQKVPAICLSNLPTANRTTISYAGQVVSCDPFLSRMGKRNRRRSIRI